MNELVMPQLGLTMTEGKVLQWYKRPGEGFSRGDPLFEVETDKVNMDVEATDSGTLAEIVAPLNETLAVKTVIARYRKAAAAGPSAPAASPARAERVKASPRARKAARELGIDLASLQGTGPGGRIVEQDIRASGAGASAASAPAAAPAAVPGAAPAPAPAERLRRLTAERTALSFQSAPHFYLTREIDAAELLSLKRALAAASAKRGGPEISLTDLLLKALALAIAAHPAVNAFWQEGRAVPHSAIALGLAVALEEGLIVPVLRQPDRLSLTGLARQRAGLVERARAGRLAPDDFGGASATLSNLGMFGVDHFQAILNPPESLILAAGRIRDRVVAVNGAPAVRPTLHATLTADHRVVDGAQAARLLAAFAEALENPGLLILPEA